jgi:hypothetical protein
MGCDDGVTGTDAGIDSPDNKSTDADFVNVVDCNVI